MRQSPKLEQQPLAPHRVGSSRLDHIAILAGEGTSTRKAFQQSLQAGAVDLLPQAARGRVLQVMGFVDHQMVVLGQQAAADLGIGEQEGVVDDDQVRGFGLGSSPVHVAVLFRAVNADAIQRIRRDARP